ncbi:MAG: S-layer homology domain-containing protein [Sedimentibacter saalensis]|uniref:S-layer family protein n=1 Tax=Sedimentibacter saalensis TaxID=130788 RepID=A0A562J8Y1_9FIRM|nr:S-layer homology domain-containing protein [Sedimentibacter saalensis]MEA5093502.1 S-layer homology domain-containing protein [Sedimentibacter saalensis]TWH79384.1 S-layer family protein [Sedimentibacter saalensis]
MNKIKKTIAIILCLVLATSGLAFAEEVAVTSAPATDYTGHWAEGTIQKWMDAGKISGYSDGSYKPDNNITRAEFVKLVNGTIDFSKKANVAYKDVTTADWFYDYVGIAQEIGYISGYSKDSFGPNDYITREQAASILARIQYLNGNVAAANKFSDKSKVSSWAAESVGAALDAGFVTGYNDGTFRPSNKLTRAEALTMLDNVLVNAKNVVVYKDGAELKDKVVAGDLIIAKTVGEGNVHLTNVEVKGEIKVLGGGLNSVYFNNVKVSNIEVLKDKVRLVFADGSVIENLTTGTETVLENTDGTIAKVTVSGNGEVTLTGNFGEVTVTGSSNITLDDAVITKLVVEQKITIEGTGTIATLEANANGIKYEAEVKITKTVTGEGVTEKPAVVVVETSGGGGGGGGSVDPVTVPALRVSFIENTNTYRFSYTYKDTDNDISEFLLFMIDDILSDSSNNEFINDYLGKVNSRLDEMYAGDTKVYSEEGWNKAIVYLDNTNIKEDIQGLKSALLDGTISPEDIIALIGVFNDSNTSDANAILENLTANDIDQKIMQYKGVDVKYSLKSNASSTPITNTSDIATFIIDNILYSDISVDAFLQQFGTVELTVQYGENIGKIIIDKNSIVK